jgi:SAM-dependent methyltransferase
VAQNVAEWTAHNAEYGDANAANAWAKDEISWGVFGVSDAEIGALGDVRGLDVVELGCGVAYFSARLAKLGARPVGVDPTPAQLATARRMMEETGIEFPLVQAAGESVPLPDASFDVALSEYGASLWAVPERWVAEAARLLRPHGRLVFLVNSPLSILCMPDKGQITEQLQRSADYFGVVEWPDEHPGVEYILQHGNWVQLLRAHGFEVEALHELRAPADAETHSYYDYVTAEWAKRWPCEDVWVARKCE